MSLHRIAQDYVTRVQAGQYLELIDSLYADDAVSVEAVAHGSERAVQGIEAIRGKSEWFDSNHEIHSHTIEGPWPHGDDKFAVRMSFDMTHLESAQRRTLEEIAVLTVRDGKIVKEEFFYQG